MFARSLHLLRLRGWQQRLGPYARHLTQQSVDISALLAAPLPDKYDPKFVEQHWYEYWERSGHFKPNTSTNTESIVHVIKTQCEESAHTVLNPLFFSTERVRPAKWVHGLSSLVSWRFGKFSFTSSVMQSCFKSIFLSRNQEFLYLSYPFTVFPLQHAFFKEMNISRAPLPRSMRSINAPLSRS